MRLSRPTGGGPSGGDEDEADAADDAALLRAVARGDTEALAVLYDRHAGWLHARLARRCPDEETVREVLQDTFVTVWRSAGGHRGRGEAGGWLWVIAARRLVDAQRARARAERAAAHAATHAAAHVTAQAGAHASAHAAFPAPPVVAPSAEERVLAGLEYAEVGAALDRISPELAEVLRATVVDGLTTRETARLLGIPEGTVKTRALRARRELRAALAAGHPGGPHALGGTA
ncbi:RNA polymerase sigma factor [Streptomyces exfoliatus]|uniref:RNA polymerase sigma factor n=1 Tax=Streptomyces exfoliatus TaxID=1905 RepID=UPI000690CFB5